MAKMPGEPIELEGAWSPEAADEEERRRRAAYKPESSTSPGLASTLSLVILPFSTIIE